MYHPKRKQTSRIKIEKLNKKLIDPKKKFGNFIEQIFNDAACVYCPKYWGHRRKCIVLDPSGVIFLTHRADHLYFNRLDVRVK